MVEWSGARSLQGRVLRVEHDDGNVLDMRLPLSGQLEKFDSVPVNAVYRYCNEKQVRLVELLVLSTVSGCTQKNPH